jgi:hypothetical protein
MSDDSVNFKAQYKPNCVYNQVMNETSHTETKYDASPAMIQMLKEKGIENNSKTDKTMKVLIVLKTGSLGSQSSFPFSMEYLKTTSKVGTADIPDSTTFYGTDTLGKTPVIDSLTSPKELSTDFKKELASTVQNILQESCGPEKKMKVGEYFTRESPTNIDMGGIKLQITTTTTYQLKSIENNTATFEIATVYTFNSTITNHTYKAEGEGKGMLVYDLKDNYYKDYSEKVVFGMSMDIGGIYAVINSTTDINIQTTLEQN